MESVQADAGITFVFHPEIAQKLSERHRKRGKRAGPNSDEVAVESEGEQEEDGSGAKSKNSANNDDPHAKRLRQEQQRQQPPVPPGSDLELLAMIADSSERV